MELSKEQRNTVYRAALKIVQTDNHHKFSTIRHIINLDALRITVFKGFFKFAEAMHNAELSPYHNPEKYPEITNMEADTNIEKVEILEQAIKETS